ncbi:MAG: Rne/Rng family ribonuclease, partial [Synechococcales cyanobacterium RM1_1_8]|nr:Rne/Rng family ribonuclease [Synechococcales cyanobacterium RM1_1_8]
MAKQIIIAEQHRIAAVFEDDQIQELIVAKGTQQVSDIYLGSVENVLPSIDAAFVNIGDSEKNGFIHMGDLGPLKLRRNGGSITDLLRPQQKVLVQVMKEPTGNKGPRLTGNVSLPGRYLVLMPFGRGVNLSRRISSEAERSRLRALAVFIKPAAMGLLIRTEAEGVDEEAIIEDLELLMGQWENIQQEMETASPPALMNRDDDFIQRVLRDAYNSDANRIVVDSHTGLKRVKQYLTSWSSGQLPQGILIDHHSGPSSILEYFRVNAAIREALKPRVDLPSGGYIIIEPTEALVVVDVNSGSFTRSATSRETVLWTNFEAATELARQLRLRNLAGVIVVDFIDMDHRSDQLRVLEHFTKALKADKSRPQIAQLSELGLVELTRKRQGQNIYELFGQPCPSCSGLGHLVLLPGETPVSESEAEEGLTLPGERLSTVRANPRSRRGGRTIESRSTGAAGRSPRGLPAPPSLDSAGPTPVQSPDSSVSSSPATRGNAGGSAAGRPPALGSFSAELAGAKDRGTDSDEPPLERSRRRRRRNEDSEEGDGQERSAGATYERGESETGESRGRRERGSRPLEPVVVEMTADEQDIYAWLGISPLLLQDSDLDPQSALITVTLPGEKPPEAVVRKRPSPVRGVDADDESGAELGGASASESSPAPILARTGESTGTEQAMLTDPEARELETDREETGPVKRSRRVISRRRLKHKSEDGSDGDVTNGDTAGTMSPDPTAGESADGKSDGFEASGGPEEADPDKPVISGRRPRSRRKVIGAPGEASTGLGDRPSPGISRPIAPPHSK